MYFLLYLLFLNINTKFFPFFRLLNERPLNTMDGTFKALPKVLKAYQLFTVAVIKNHVVSSPHQCQSE